MERREARLLAIAAPILVLVSSYLGLGGRFFFVAPLDALRRMVGIWSMSIAADAAFVVGTLAAGALGYLVARHGLLALAFVLGLGSHSLTYWTSYVLLPGTGDGLVGVAAGEALYFVAAWGVVGLLAASALPPFLARAWARHVADERPADEPDAAPSGDARASPAAADLQIFMVARSARHACPRR